MKNILPIVLVLIAVAGAGFVAKMIRGAPAEIEDPNAVEEAGVDEAHGDDPDATGKMGYYKFGRDYIVPVMRGRDVDSLILLRILVEMDPDKLEVFRPKEPRIRDAFMQTLLRLSHDGLFSGDITAPSVYQEIQASLLATANDVMDGEANAVLIVDFARQDQ